jgi:hypothetical protein
LIVSCLAHYLEPLFIIIPELTRDRGVHRANLRDNVRQRVIHTSIRATRVPLPFSVFLPFLFQ